MDTEDPGTPRDESDADDAGRREFLRSVAIKGALTALFGGVTLDAVTAQVASRIEERSALRAAGSGAGGTLRRFYPQGIICGDGFVCGGEVPYSCRTFTCGPGGFTCDRDFKCRASFECTSAPGSDYFCNIVVECQGSFVCSGVYECPGGGY